MNASILVMGYVPIHYKIRHNTYDIMKTYGRLDSSWTYDKIKDVLEDTANLAIQDNTTYCIGISHDQKVIVFDSRKRPSSVFVCSVHPVKDSKKHSNTEKEFGDNVAYARYTIHEMIAKVQDALIHGIIDYGEIGFLSEGRFQLVGVLEDAKKMSEMYQTPYIVGMSKKRGIMIAPASEKSQFVAPLSCIISKSGFWNISSTCSYMVGHYQCIIDAPDVYKRSEQGGVTNPMYMLYEAIAYRTKQYGKFQHETGRTRLVQAFEDAATISEYDQKAKCYVGLTSGDIKIQCIQNTNVEKEYDVFFPVKSGQFCDKELDLEKIKAAAHEAYRIVTDSINYKDQAEK